MIRYDQVYGNKGGDTSSGSPKTKIGYDKVYKSSGDSDLDKKYQAYLAQRKGTQPEQQVTSITPEVKDTFQKQGFAAASALQVKRSQETIAPNPKKQTQWYTDPSSPRNVWNDTVQRIGDFVDVMGDKRLPSTKQLPEWYYQSHPEERPRTGTITPSERIGKFASAVQGVASLALSPITAVATQAEKLHGFGIIAKGVNRATQAIGQAGSYIVSKLVDTLPLPEDTKNNIRTPLAELGGLVAQVVTFHGAAKVGGGVLKTASKSTSLGDFKARIITKTQDVLRRKQNATSLANSQSIDPTTGTSKPSDVVPPAELTPGDAKVIVNEVAKETPVKAKGTVTFRPAGEQPIPVQTNQRIVLESFLKNREDVTYKKVRALGNDVNGNPVASRFEWDYKNQTATIYTTNATTAANIAHEIGHYFDHKLSLRIANNFSDIIPDYLKNKDEVKGSLAQYAVYEMDGKATPRDITNNVKSLVNDFNTDIPKLAEGEMRGTPNEVFASAVKTVLTDPARAREIAPRFTGFVEYFADKQGLVADLVKKSKPKEVTAPPVESLNPEWSELQKQNPDLFNTGILRKSQNPMGAKGVIPEDVHSMQGKWQNYGQNDVVPANVVYERINSGSFKGEYVDKQGNPVRDANGAVLQDTYNKSTQEWEVPKITNKDLKDNLLNAFSTKEGKDYLNKVITALPKNPDGSITAYRIGAIGEGVQSYTLSEGMAKTFSNQGTDILPAGTPGLPKEGYEDFGVLPANVVKIDPKGIVAWSPYDAEILVEPKYVKTKPQFTNIRKRANEAYQSTVKNGGVTISLEGNKPTSGVAYAPFKGTELTIDKAKFTPDTVAEYMAKHEQELSQPGNHIGLWEDNGKVYLDISKVGELNADTLQNAMNAKQLAAFDLSTLGTGKDGNIPLGKIENGVYTPLYEASNHPYLNQGENAGASPSGTTGQPAEIRGSQTTGTGESSKASLGESTTKGVNESSASSQQAKTGAGKGNQALFSGTGLKTGKYVKDRLSYNPEKINAPADVDALLRETAEREGEFSKQRISKSDAKIRELAQMVGVTSEELVKLKPGSIANAETTMKARQLVADLAVDLRDTIRSLQAETATPEQLQMVKEKAMRLQGTMQAVAGLRTESSNVFRQFNLEARPGENDIMREVVSSLKTIDAKAGEDIAQFAKGFNKDVRADMLNELIVKKRNGKPLSEQEAMVLNEKTATVNALEPSVYSFENMVANKENVIQYLQAVNDLQKYMQRLSPAHNLRVFTELVGRGTMLFSIKSPLLNIESNVIQGALQMAEKRMARGKVANVIDNADVVNYVKFVTDVMNKTGFDLTRMIDVGDIQKGVQKVLGETRVHAEGSGVVRAVGRFYEKYIFRKTLGVPDVISSAVQAADTAKIAATTLAKSEGLTGIALKTRATEIFNDILSPNPLTEEGQIMRKQAVVDASYATWQDSKVEVKKNGTLAIVPGTASATSLAIRAAINKATGDFRLGDLNIPFAKTPANVVSAGLESAGGSLFTGLYKIKKAMFDKNLDTAGKQTMIHSAVRGFIRAGIGLTAATVIASLLDKNDFIGTYPTDEKERRLLTMRGGTENMIRIGNKWISLEYFGAIGVPIAGMMYAKKYGNNFPEKFLAYLQGSGEQVLRLPGIKEAYDLVKGFQENLALGMTPQKILQNSKSNILDFVRARTVPGFINDIAVASDSSQRETGGQSTAKFRASIPGMRKNLPVKVNVLGEELRTTGAGQIFFGARVKDFTEDPVKNFLVENRLTISVPAKNTEVRVVQNGNESKRQMTQQEYYKYVKYSGVEIKKQLEQYLNDFRGYSHDDQQKYIDKIVNQARKRTKLGIETGVY